ncbi:MAG: hypothetical protein H0X33_13475 [Taibaiella sp.]|nr:hypothetical protein [Taibaiella sp.]
MTTSSKLLISDNPLQVLPKLAEKIGLNEALVLQQLHYWLNKSDNYRDGSKWVFNSYPGWKEQFPFWGLRTIQRTFLKLENLGLIKVANFNKMKGDLTKWYTVDYEGVTALEQSSLLRENPSCQNGTMPSCQNGTTIVPKSHDPSCQNGAANTRDYVPETTTKTNSIMPPPRPALPVKSQGPTEGMKIADYFAKAINSHKDTLSSMDYKNINKLVADGFTLDRCQPGIDSAVNGIRSRPGGVVGSFQACLKSIYQLDPAVAKPISINRPFDRKQQQLTDFGTQFADTSTMPDYPKDGVYGKDFLFRAKQA